MPSKHNVLTYLNSNVNWMLLSVVYNNNQLCACVGATRVSMCVGMQSPTHAHMQSFLWLVQSPARFTALGLENFLPLVQAPHAKVAAITANSNVGLARV